MLDELERQHVRENTLIDALSTALARHEHGDAGAAAAFTCAIQHLSGAVWEHMSLEETVILPAARRHLTTPTGQWSIKPFPRTKPPPAQSLLRNTDEAIVRTHRYRPAIEDKSPRPTPRVMGEYR